MIGQANMGGMSGLLGSMSGMPVGAMPMQNMPAFMPNFNFMPQQGMMPQFPMMGMMGFPQGMMPAMRKAPIIDMDRRLMPGPKAPIIDMDRRLVPPVGGGKAPIVDMDRRQIPPTRGPSRIM